MSEVYIKVKDLNRWVAKYFEKKDLITIEDLIATIEELDDEIQRQKEKYEELEEDLHSNYRPIPVCEQVDVDEKDFY